jgi:hypothetical protein
MCDSGIINVLLSLQKDVVDVLNEKNYDEAGGGSAEGRKERGRSILILSKKEG